MSFPRYPAYKPSGVEWLGVVPEHWSIKQLKHCIHRLGSGGTPESGNPDYWADDESDNSIPWVAIGDMSSASVVYSTAKSLTQAGITEKNLEIFPAGSLLYSIYASLGKVSILGVDAAFNQAILAIVSNSDLVSQSFLKYWLENIEKHLSYYSNSNTQANLNAAKVLAYPVAVPHPDEQARIATFLDRETAKIDALIAEQQRLIELLQEKRQAVISQAVTKGLNPNAPMKDSGVEWLGEVPEHWTICPLKHFCKITTGFAFKSDDFQDEGIPLLRISDIQCGGTIDLKDAKCLRESELLIRPREIVKQGDIAMAMTGGTIGKAGIYSSDKPALLNQRVCIFRAKLDCTQAFLWLITASRFYQEHIRLSSFGGAQPNISDGDLLACVCPIPPLAEQQEISACVDTQAARLGELQRKADSTIELLNERRSALISAAVTGQIDVRGLGTEEEP
jgi:type I restriction enzyme, S subunit